MTKEQENDALTRPVRGAVPFAEIEGDDEEDKTLLRKMADMTTRYVLSYKWCLELKDGYLADGIRGVIGIFFFRASVRGFNGDQWIWVFMGGDVPSAYLMLGRQARYYKKHWPTN